VERIAHYRLTGRLGKGAMGEVYRAVDERLGREVALKLLPLARADNHDLQLRLLREAQAASALNHPGIVTVHDVGSWRGRVYVVMELIDGERFSDVARSGVAIGEALRLVAEAADALGSAHARGILHRDIKSDNLMRTRDGRVKVLDFGLAKTSPHEPVESSPFRSEPKFDPVSSAPTLPPEEGAGPAPPGSALAPSEELARLHDAAPTGTLPLSPPPDATHPGQLLGTPAYMSPEQTRGALCDAQTEVFSLGVVLYELLVGRTPWQRATLDEMLQAVRTAELIPPSVAEPARRIPPAVDAVAMRALSRDRATRFAGMRELAAALRAAGAPRRARSIGIGLAAVALGGIAALAFALTRPSPTANAVVRSAHRLTFAPGCEEYPSFLPDGRSLIFDGNSGGDDELLQLDLSSGATRRLTTSPGWDYGAAISPDGKQVAYVHIGARREARVVDLSTLAVRELGAAAGGPGWNAAGEPVLSRDGSSVVALGSGGERTLAQVQPSQQIHYMVGFPDGALALLLQESTTPPRLTLAELSPSGATRVLEAGMPYDQIGLAVTDGAAYYGRHRGSVNELVRRPRSGGEPFVVPGGISPSSGITISRDGSKLAWSTCRESVVIARLPDGEGAPVELMARGGWRDRAPSRLDDDRILFTSDRSGADRLYVWKARTREAIAVPGSGDGASLGRPSPDGRMVVYQNRGLWLAPLDGSAAARPLTQDASDGNPRFSFDGTRVVFTRDGADGTRVWVAALDGKAHAISPPRSRDPGVSPTDDRVVFVAETAEGDRVELTDLAGAPPRALPLPAGTWLAPAFSADGKRLLVVRGSTELLELDLAAPAAVPRVRYRAGTDGIAAIESSRSGILLTLEVYDGDLWLAEGMFR
jgi:serine/threonine protein kinase/Tol biopolymer transport system component